MIIFYLLTYILRTSVHIIRIYLRYKLHYLRTQSIIQYTKEQQQVFFLRITSISN